MQLLLISIISFYFALVNSLIIIIFHKLIIKYNFGIIR